MGKYEILDSEYKKRIKSPLIKVTIKKSLAEPSIDPALFVVYYPQVLQGNIGLGYDQIVSECTLRLPPIYDDIGDYVVFEPMDNVIIEQGWNSPASMHRTFYGFVDSVELQDFPRVQVLACSDVLKLARINYYTESNKKEFYSISGGVTVSAWIYADDLISEFLTESGIPEVYQQVGEITISGVTGAGTRAIIGAGANIDNPISFYGVNAADAIAELCNTLGYRCWATTDGVVNVAYVKPYAGEEAALVYKRMDDTFSGEDMIPAPFGFDPYYGGHLLKYEGSITDEYLRNYINVRGYTDPVTEETITATVFGPSDYIPEGVDYRRAQKDSWLLDTSSLATWTAIQIYEDLNRLLYNAKIEISGDPRLEIGLTVSIVDGYLTQWTDDEEVEHDDRKYFVYDINSIYDGGGWSMSVGLKGGTGPGAPPATNISPVAEILATYEYEYMDGVDAYIVVLDGSTSYDPDGEFSDLSFEWEAEGFGAVAGVTATYIVLGDSISVTLRVTDSGEIPLTGVATKTFEFERSKATTKVVYVAAGKYVYSTFDGGQHWNAAELY